MALALEIPTAYLSLDTLIRLQYQITQELQERRILRNGNGNNFTADLAEYLFKSAFPWTLVESGSQAGHDATDSDEVRYQIKARRNASLIHIAKLETKPFDVLAFVRFAADDAVDFAVLVPWAVVHAHAKPQRSKNNHILTLTQKIRALPTVQDVTEKVAQALQTQGRVQGQPA